MGTATDVTCMPSAGTSVRTVCNGNREGVCVNAKGTGKVFSEEVPPELIL